MLPLFNFCIEVFARITIFKLDIVFFNPIVGHTSDVSRTNLRLLPFSQRSARNVSSRVQTTLFQAPRHIN